MSSYSVILQSSILRVSCFYISFVFFFFHYMLPIFPIFCMLNLYNIYVPLRTLYVGILSMHLCDIYRWHFIDSKIYCYSRYKYILKKYKFDVSMSSDPKPSFIINDACLMDDEKQQKEQSLNNCDQQSALVRPTILPVVCYQYRYEKCFYLLCCFIFLHRQHIQVSMCVILILIVYV